MSAKQAKTSINKMSGPVVPTNVALDKQGFLDQMGEVFATDIFPTSWTPAQVEEATAELFDRRFMSGFWSKIPRICSAECPHCKNNTCRLTKKPWKERCPEESAFVELLFRRYVEDLQIGDHDMASLSMIRDLVDIEMLLLRKQGILASSEIVIDNVVAVDRQGNEITSLVEHPVMASGDRLQKRKKEILQTLLATREAKAKVASDVVRIGEMAKAAEALKKMRQAIAAGERPYDTNWNGFTDEFVDAEVVEEPEDSPPTEE